MKKFRLIGLLFKPVVPLQLHPQNHKTPKVYKQDFFFSPFIDGCEFSMHTCTIKVTFAINSILKLSHKKLSSTKLEKNRNSKVIVKFMKQFCNTQRLIA